MSPDHEGIETIMFEPWSLGDAVIAAAIARLGSGRWALACRREWHPILRGSTANGCRFPLMSVSAPYTEKSRKHWASGIRFLRVIGARRKPRETAVVSIRGDPRDWLLAKARFPGLRVRMGGWIPSLAWHSRIADLPFRKGLLPTTNRYRLWAKSVGLSWDELQSSYRLTGVPERLISKKVLIHVGARWKSKQYPHIGSLCKMLRAQGAHLSIVRGPGDEPPGEMAHEAIETVYDGLLIDRIRESDIVVTNDSGPMHLSAYIGKVTFVLCKIANMAYWTPPGMVIAVASDAMPRGYAPLPGYASDRAELEGWIAPEVVTETIRRSLDGLSRKAVVDE